MTDIASSLPLVVTEIRKQIPDLMAIYGFGSQFTGNAGTNSDLDLAVLVAGKADTLQLWQVSSELAELAGCHVDLLDLRAASTVMQYQIITQGERLWQLDHQAGVYESFILSAKTELDEARAGLLQDIQQRGSVYGR